MYHSVTQPEALYWYLQQLNINWMHLILRANTRLVAYAVIFQWNHCMLVRGYSSTGIKTHWDEGSGLNDFETPTDTGNCLWDFVDVCPDLKAPWASFQMLSHSKCFETWHSVIIVTLVSFWERGAGLARGHAVAEQQSCPGLKAPNHPPSLPQSFQEARMCVWLPAFP